MEEMEAKIETENALSEVEKQLILKRLYFFVTSIYSFIIIVVSLTCTFSSLFNTP